MSGQWFSALRLWLAKTFMPRGHELATYRRHGGNRGAVRIAAKGCKHDWRYDEAESRGGWTGYIERCAKCRALTQVPQ